MIKALKLLKKYGYLINQYTMDLVSNDIHEAIAELEERQKEDEYIHQKMKESLSMGNKAQSLAFVEVYQIINNRVSK
jgi:hypothetical protein